MGQTASKNKTLPKRLVKNAKNAPKGDTSEGVEPEGQPGQRFKRDPQNRLQWLFCCEFCIVTFAILCLMESKRYVMML